MRAAIAYSPKMPVASFHLTRYRRATAPEGLSRMGLDRPLLSRTPGLRFYRLLGTGQGRDDDPRRRTCAAGRCSRSGRRTGARRVPRRLGDRRRAGATWRPRPTRSDSRRCARTARGAGATRWTTSTARRAATARSPSSPARPSGCGACAPSTPRSLPPATALARSPGRLASVGVGEWPVARQATFSLWRSVEDVQAFAYRRGGHRAVIAPHPSGGLVLRGALRAVPTVRGRG